MDLLREKFGRLVCVALVGVDVVLGGIATFVPAQWAALFHPELPAADIPVDFIVRTGVLWLAFLVFQAIAASVKHPRQWFFAVGLIRLMEVPADVIYSALARGATLTSRLMILSAPVLNAIFGTYLLLLARRLARDESTTSTPG